MYPLLYIHAWSSSEGSNACMRDMPRELRSLEDDDAQACPDNDESIR
jgi:hypothetical protein